MTHENTKSKPTYREVNEDVLRLMTQTGPGYYIILAIAGALALILFFLPWAYQIYTGQGVTGLNVPVIWGVYLVNFVFWVGMAHAGTLISAMLFITKTPWRRAITRGAETVTFFSLILVALFIFIHMGRPWNLYWTMPYPSQRQIWTSFISPITFDVFAIGTYTTSSAIFLYFGMIPDFASLKHHTTGWRKTFYTYLSLGWRGTDPQWVVHGRATMFFSSFIMPLVVSVHSIVSWDFAMSLVPGYSQTVFAPYFVTGALLSGFAGVMLIFTVLRWAYPFLKKYITEHHYERVGTCMLLLSLVWSYLTGMEVFTGWYADTSFEIEHLKYKILTQPYLQLFALMIFCNAILPLSLIFRKIRTSSRAMPVLCIFVLTGMWLERYLIIPNALSRKFLPWMWHGYSPSWVEISITAGAFMFFIFMFMVSIKIFPVISLFEVKEDLGVPMEKERHK
ncbi:MAG: NrfD/PsrC family molybdoenzyme membrane anchor subunit [Deltaproteobacteria bacterium]|nr:NrfD/PsrC family molybdoenzyme membrane anchor subunit [Deltaproteobacteria bacterium]